MAQLSDDLRLRHYFVPFVRDATKCIASETIKEHAIVGVRTKDDLEPIIRDVMPRCQREINIMVARGNQIYGFGGGRDFLDGPYTADLPRAVMLLVKKDLPARQAQIRRDDAETAAAQARADQERRDQEAREDESRRLVREREAAAERAAADRAKAEALEQEEEKRKRTEVARRSMELIRDKAYDCIASQLNDLVKSGEPADVMASASMTLCDDQVEAAVKAGIEVYAVEQNQGGIMPGSELAQAFTTRAKSSFRERAVALAVKVKASMNAH